MFSYYIKYGIRYSLRYILKYFIRLVIFFALIFLISFLSGKHLFISDVHAMESTTKIPNDMYFYDNYSLGPGYTNLQTASIFNKDYYGGLSKKSNGHYSGVSFLFNFGKPNVYGNTSFIFVTSSNIKGNDFPIRAFMWGPAGESIICNVESSSTNVPTNTGTGTIFTTNYFSTINCPITKIGSNGTLRLFINSDFEVDSSSFFGIAAGTLYIDDGVQNSLKQIEKQAKETNNFIKNDNVDSSTNQGSSFFNDFNSGDEGSLTDIVSLPLDYVQHLNDTCHPFTIPAGNLGNFTIPCLSSIWSSTSFAGIINTASLIINGIICYKLLTSLFLFFKELKDPDDDKVEVMNL